PPPTPPLFPYTTLFRSYARPNTATVPSSGIWDRNVVTIDVERVRLNLSLASSSSHDTPTAFPKKDRATLSRGKQGPPKPKPPVRSEEHTSELQSPCNLV